MSKSPARDGYDAVNGERMRDYGHPAKQHAITADLLNSLGFVRITPDGEVVSIQAEDISVFHRMDKEARKMTSPDHYDHYVDLVGYVETEWMVHEARQEFQAPDPPPITVPPDDEVFAAPIPRPEDYDERQLEDFGNEGGN